MLGDHILSGDPTVGGASQPAAVAGYPSITVPAGFVHGLPVGIVLMTRQWGEPTLISIAYGFEQHAHAFKRRRLPRHRAITGICPVGRAHSMARQARRQAPTWPPDLRTIIIASSSDCS